MQALMSFLDHFTVGLRSESLSVILFTLLLGSAAGGLWWGSKQKLSGFILSGAGVGLTTYILGFHAIAASPAAFLLVAAWIFFACGATGLLLWCCSGGAGIKTVAAALVGAATLILGFTAGWEIMSVHALAFNADTITIGVALLIPITWFAAWFSCWIKGARFWWTVLSACLIIAGTAVALDSASTQSAGWIATSHAIVRADFQWLTSGWQTLVHLWHALFIV